MSRPAASAARAGIRMCLFSLPGLILFYVLFLIGFLEDSAPQLLLRGLIIAALSAIIHLALLLFAAARLRDTDRARHVESTIAGVVVACCLNLTVFLLIPVTLDRSVTVLLLHQLAESEQGASVSELNRALHHVYIDQCGAVSRRISEQRGLRTVAQHDGHWQLTFLAKRVFITTVSASNYIFGPSALLQCVQEEEAAIQ